MIPTTQPETVFTVTINEQEIRVRYRPHHIAGRDAYAMLEFTSPHEPRTSIPLCDGGYRSFFAPMMKSRPPRASRSTPRWWPFCWPRSVKRTRRSVSAGGRHDKRR